MDINSLKDNLNKSLAEVSTKGIPSANFEPVWINNITRLNAQNFNARMYPTIASYITGYGDAVFEGSNEQLSNLLTILPGYKVSDSIPTEIHNIEADLSSTNKASGSYQAVFGIGNTTGSTIGQFIVGKYNKIGEDFLFAIGNGTNDNDRSNAIEVSSSGELKTSNISVINGITTPYVKITGDITDDTYAATKKYVDTKVKEESDRAQEVENNKQDKFAEYEADPSATQSFLTSITESLDIVSSNSSGSLHGVSISPGSVGLHSNDPLGASLYIESTTARFGPPSSTGIPVLGISTPVNTSTSGIGTEDIPYQAVNKEYVDTNILDVVKFYSPSTSYSYAQFNTPGVGLTLQGGIGLTVKYNQSEISGIQIGVSGPPILQFTNANYICGIPTPIKTVSGSDPLPSSLLGTQAVNKDYVDTNFQVKLESGTNIKTINGTSILGDGDLVIQGGGGSITIDSELSTTSTNPVQNKIITNTLTNKQDKITGADTLEVDQIKLNNVLLNASTPDSNDIIMLRRAVFNTNDTVEFASNGSDPVELKNLKDGTENTSAATVGQLNEKQDKITQDTNLSANELQLNGGLLFNNKSTISTTTEALNFQGISTQYIKLKGVADGTDSKDAVNKSQLDTKLSASTDNYTINWDTTNEAIKITFHE